MRKEILDILAYRKCKGDGGVAQDGKGIICKNCKLLYPVWDNIPLLLDGEANHSTKTE